MASKKKLFAGGRNIAVKMPPHEFEDATHFYRNVLGLEQLSDFLPSVVFEYGANLLWLDRVETISQAEVWLELRTADTTAAARHLDGHHVVRCDAVEPLPDGFDGFWISAPGNIVHLVHGPREAT